MLTKTCSTRISISTSTVTRLRLTHALSLLSKDWKLKMKSRNARRKKKRRLLSRREERRSQLQQRARQSTIQAMTHKFSKFQLRTVWTWVSQCQLTPNGPLLNSNSQRTERFVISLQTRRSGNAFTHNRMVLQLFHLVESTGSSFVSWVRSVWLRSMTEFPAILDQSHCLPELKTLKKSGHNY